MVCKHSEIFADVLKYQSVRVVRLTKLSNSLLDLAKSENALNDPELIDISEIIKEVIG